jgi:serine/threonine protein kinase
MQGLMAPEIITDLSSADGRAADMWSMGAMLLWLVEGELRRGVDRSVLILAAVTVESTKISFSNSISRTLSKLSEKPGF